MFYSRDNLASTWVQCKWQLYLKYSFIYFWLVNIKNLEPPSYDNVLLLFFIQKNTIFSSSSIKASLNNIFPIDGHQKWIYMIYDFKWNIKEHLQWHGVNICLYLILNKQIKICIHICLICGCPRKRIRATCDYFWHFFSISEFIFWILTVISDFRV